MLFYTRLLMAIMLGTASLCSMASANSDDIRWIYCEATRIDDGVRVSYTFRIENNVAYSKYGTWQVYEDHHELRLFYIHEDGKIDRKAFIFIDRFTGELYHNVYGISVYKTQPDDRPCRTTNQHF